MNVEEFYNDFASEYTASVLKCNPCYHEMVQSLLDYLPETMQPTHVLDLGCGSGNLTILLEHAYPESNIEKKIGK